ncbi:hypothetical protein CPT_Shady_068 [Streptomyces phage Shady]|uniref:Uncharacterized protein n=1 Tax=Streptomyces phage Shady TaxID=2767585 RepID=A0A873WEB1_9CAUD|nr:hypothetical protein CPT_Shady_068 [Streptomyces phage Shady]
MTAPPQPRNKPAKVRSPFPAAGMGDHSIPGAARSLRALDEMPGYCGYCTGHRWVWCPDCAGFTGCATCNRSTKVRCPCCAGGDREKWSR